MIKRVDKRLQAVQCLTGNKIKIIACIMLERHLPKQLLHLVDKARDLLPEHQTYRQEKQHERGHSWGDMSL